MHKRKANTRTHCGALSAALVLACTTAALATTFTVTKTADTNDGTCDTDCSLREAIIAANTTAGADTVIVPAGTYMLTLLGSGEDAAATGDLDINGELTLTGAGAATTIIDGNGASADPDRVFQIISGTVSISGVTIQNGKWTGNDSPFVPGDGGGIFNFSGTVTLTDSTLSGNSAIAGGGIWNAGPFTLTNSTLSGNSADFGGGIENWGPLTIINSTLSGNSTTSGGGGGIENFATAFTLTITNSTLSGNSASRGAGILNAGLLSLANTTLSGNSSATIGGGIYNCCAGTGTLTNTTLSGNSAASGGGIYIFGPLTLTLTNSIVANSPPSSNCVGLTASADGGHNLDNGASCGFSAANGSLNNTTPNLAGLANNGGPTQTIALQAGSPAVNAGDESVCVAPPVNNLDQRGYARPGTGHTQCSIGAYEADATPPEVCVGDCGGPATVTIDEIITLVNIALGNAQPSACPDGVPSGDVTVAVIMQAVNNALSGCGLVCGNGSVEPGEDCDDGGTCIGGSNAGTACTAEAECLGTGVCMGGAHVGMACDANDASACPGSTCRKCVPFGGDGCAANCTTETDVPFYLVPGEQGVDLSIVAGTSGGIIHTDVLTIPLPLSGSEMLTVGKERDGQIPVVIKAATVHFAAVQESTLFCECVRAIAARTCGGTWLEPDGVTPSLDCTPGYTAGDNVCAGKHPCTFVHGPGNAAAGVIGCAGLDAINADVEQDGTDAVPCNSDADCTVTGTCLARLECAPRPPRITLTGTGGAGSALLLSSRAFGSSRSGGVLCTGTGPAYGPDGQFCTDDDPQDTRGTVITTPQTTGMASGTFLNANGFADSTVGPFTAAGSPLSCGALLGPQPATVPATLASALTAANILAYGSNGNAVVTELLVAGPPIPTPTITKTPTPTVTGTPPPPTRTPTSTSPPPRTPTPTRTQTPTRTPNLPRTHTSTPPPTPTPTITPTPQSRFVDNGDGTITDTSTGLMWEKKDQSGGIHDVSNLYTWSSSDPYTAADGTAFLIFLATLNTSPCFAGHCDWRLPTSAGCCGDPTGQAAEIESIVDRSAPGCNSSPFPPCIYAAFNTNCAPGCSALGCSCTTPYFYWSASTDSEFPHFAWGVGLLNGSVYSCFKRDLSWVRAVRGEGCCPTPSPTNTFTPAPPTNTFTPAPPTNTFTPAPPTFTFAPGPRFVDNGDGTITDHHTGLMWEKKDQGGGYHDVNTFYVWAGGCSDGSGLCQPDSDSAMACSKETNGAVGCAQCGGTATCDTFGYTTIWQWLVGLNKPPYFAGYTNWRIPTVAEDGGAAELETIIDTSAPGCGISPYPPCVDTVFNNSCQQGCTWMTCSCTASAGYWSAITYAPVPQFAWFVNFNFGYVDFNSKGYYHVRAVR